MRKLARIATSSLHQTRMARHLALVVLTAFATVGVTACSGSADGPQPIDNWSGVELSEYQQRLAADGVVSDADLRDAYERAAECTATEGWQVTVIPASPGGLALNVSYGANDDGEAAISTMNKCLDEWVGPLSSIYLSAQAPTGAEREREFSQWQECMTANGASVEGAILGQPQDEMLQRLQEVNDRAFPEWDSTWQDCMDRYYLALWPEMFGGASG